MMTEAVRVANQTLPGLQAVLVGAVAYLQCGRAIAHAELYVCALSKIAGLHGERPTSQLSSASSPCDN